MYLQITQYRSQHHDRSNDIHGNMQDRAKGEFAIPGDKAAQGTQELGHLGNAQEPN